MRYRPNTMPTTPHTFLWHDYETFGRVPRSDRPVQFAGVRTNEALEEIEAPITLYCQPAPDSLPDPEACLLTGITPAVAHERGVPEHRFAQAILDALSKPGTIGVGYNSIRFDDEVTRFMFWRNLIDPYAREFQNDCGRWDLMDVVRCCYALRPDGIQWPKHDDGRASFKLEHLTQANGLTHDAAHDALSDVRATVALARCIRAAQPKLWDFCLRLRKKQAVIDEISGAQVRGEPIIHISGQYPADKGCMALVWPLAPHPTNKNELIVWDLAHDPSVLLTLTASDVRERMYLRTEDATPERSRLPIKTIHLNRSPVVVGNLKTLSSEQATRWGIDVALAHAHATVAAEHVPALAGLWLEVFARSDMPERDVDEDLYGGFLSDTDRRLLNRVRAMSPDQLAEFRPMFQDERLEELTFRYRARNFPQTLTDEDQERWAMACIDKLVDGAFGARTLESFVASLDALDVTHTDERARGILASLRAYAEAIAP
jgi:exodeoxyribonuclease I